MKRFTKFLRFFEASNFVFKSEKFKTRSPILDKNVVTLWMNFSACFTTSFREWNLRLYDIRQCWCALFCSLFYFRPEGTKISNNWMWADLEWCLLALVFVSLLAGYVMEAFFFFVVNELKTISFIKHSRLQPLHRIAFIRAFRRMKTKMRRQKKKKKNKQKYVLLCSWMKRITKHKQMSNDEWKKTREMYKTKFTTTCNAGTKRNSSIDSRFKSVCGARLLMELTGGCALNTEWTKCSHVELKDMEEGLTAHKNKTEKV